MEKHICEKRQSMYMAVKSSAEFYPNNTALRYMFRSFSYKHLLKRINQFAFELKEIGVKKDEPVTVCLPNIPDAVYLFYAINQIGAIANVVHPLFTYGQMRDNLALTKSKYLFCLDSKFKDFKPLIDDGICVHACSPASELRLVKRIGYRFLTRKKIEKIPQEYKMRGFYNAPTLKEFDDRYENDAIYLHSGGTSGKPKVIALSSFAVNALVAQGPWIANRDNLDKLSMLAVLPMFHGFGLGIGIHIMLSDGGCDVLMPKFSPDDTIKYINRGELNMLIGVPVLFEALVNKPKFKGPGLKNVIIAWVGGDFIPSSLLDKFNRKMIIAGSDGRLRPGYGLTETVNVCCVNSVSHFKEGTVGTNLPNVKFKVVDPESLKEKKVDEDGELLVGGETLMNGYRFSDDPKANEKVFVNIDGEKYVRTGDFVSLDSDGFLSFKSRLKRLIKVNGIPVFPSEIEQAATSLPYVWECAAIGVDDTKRGHIIKLFVVLNHKMDISEETARKEISDKIVASQGVYAKPKEIIFIDKMPHTIVGKVDFKQLQ